MNVPTNLRGPMTPAGQRVRAYFAAVDRGSGKGGVFDPAQGGFDLEAPPAPWINLGWIENFERTATTQIEVLRAGAAGTAAGQARRQLGARVMFDFREWGKLQMALAGGAQHMNVLACNADAAAIPSGGNPKSGVAVLPGSTATEIVFGLGAVDYFNPGDVIAVDVDYQQQAGYVGTGIAGAYVQDAADVLHDVNYVRRVTFNVGRVASKTATSVVLGQALPGGAPLAAASAQKVISFCDREGGSFWQEWSAVFVVEEVSGGRICFFYPRLQASAAARETRIEIAKPLEAQALHAEFIALPRKDENDGELAVCWRSYFPAPSAGVY